MSRFLEAFRATVRAEMQFSHSVGSENPENPENPPVSTPVAPLRIGFRGFRDIRDHTEGEIAFSSEPPAADNAAAHTSDTADPRIGKTSHAGRPEDRCGGDSGINVPTNYETSASECPAMMS